MCVGSRGLMLESRTCNPKDASLSLSIAGIVGGGEWMSSALSTFSTTTEVPLSKAPNPQLLPGHRSIKGCPLLQVCVHGVCVFTAVCVHFGWVNAEHEFRVWVNILGCMSRHWYQDWALLTVYNQNNDSNATNQNFDLQNRHNRAPSTSMATA